MNIIAFPKGSRAPRRQGFIDPRSPLSENVCWLREPYLGPAMTPERLLLAAIVKAMPEKQGAKVLRLISLTGGDEMEGRALRMVAIDIACGCFAPLKPTNLH